MYYKYDSASSDYGFLNLKNIFAKNIKNIIFLINTINIIYIKMCDTCCAS